MKPKVKKPLYMTKRLMKQIATGGIVVAPRRAGKTTAILDLMCKDPAYVLVCRNHYTANCVKEDLTRRGVAGAERRVAHGGNLVGLRGWITKTDKVIIDEFFWNPAFTQVPYHCAVSSAPKRMIVYNANGSSLTTNANGMDIWHGHSTRCRKETPNAVHP